MNTEDKITAAPIEFAQLANASERAGFAYGIAVMDYKAAEKEGRDCADDLGVVMRAREQNARALRGAVIAAFEDQRADRILARLKNESAVNA